MRIYKITNKINGKIYIGKHEGTESDYERYMGSGLLIRRAYEKYGVDNFIKETLEICEKKEILEEREKYWIKKYNSQNKEIGYNITEGGTGGDTLSNHPDIKIIVEKISKAGKGRVFTEEHRKKLSKSSLGNTKGKSNKGIKKSQDHIEKLRQAAKKQWERQRENGYEISEEHKNKISEAKKASWQKRKQDPEYMKKVSERNRKAALARVSKRNQKS